MANAVVKETVKEDLVLLVFYIIIIIDLIIKGVLFFRKLEINRSISGSLERFSLHHDPPLGRTIISLINPLGRFYTPDLITRFTVFSSSNNIIINISINVILILMIIIVIIIIIRAMTIIADYFQLFMGANILNFNN